MNTEEEIIAQNEEANPASLESAAPIVEQDESTFFGELGIELDETTSTTDSAAPVVDDDKVSIPKSEYELLKQMAKDFEELRESNDFKVYFTLKNQGIDPIKEAMSHGAFTDWNSEPEEKVVYQYYRTKFSKDDMPDEEIAELIEEFQMKRDSLKRVELTEMRKALNGKSNELLSQFDLEYKPQTQKNDSVKELQNNLQAFCGEYKGKLFDGLDLAEELNEIQDALLNTGKYIQLTDSAGKPVPNLKALVRMAIAINPKLHKKQLMKISEVAKQKGAFEKKKELANPGEGFSAKSTFKQMTQEEYDADLKRREAELRAKQKF